MISKQLARLAARTYFPNQTIYKIEAVHADGNSLANGGIDLGLPHMNGNDFFVGVLTYWAEVAIHVLDESSDHHFSPSAVGGGVNECNTVQVACRGIVSITPNWSFIGYRVRLNDMGFTSGILRVASTGDRAMDVPTINGVELPYVSGYNIAGGSMPHGQSGIYTLPQGAVQIDCVCSAGIKAASFRLTTAAGVQEQAILVNGDTYSFDARISSSQWILEIIDLTA